MVTSPAILAESARAFVVAPAGCGKTELIAMAVSLSAERSLVLTHTHSGVNAMRERLRNLAVPSEKYEVATIASFAFALASGYPTLSLLSVELPRTTANWRDVYASAINLLKRRVLRELVARSFSGLFVDEYQDCSLPQHSIVLSIADVLPTRLLGDPLQGIFDFPSEPTINWQNDVVPEFTRLPDLTTPHRWKDNPQLGEWLAGIRSSLLSGTEFSLDHDAVDYKAESPQMQLVACHNAAIPGSRVVVLKKVPAQAHAFASRLKGRYTSMEELECGALLDFAEKIDSASSGPQAAALLVDFAAQCFTKLKTELASALPKYRTGSLAWTGRQSKAAPMIKALDVLASDYSTAAMLEAAQAMEAHTAGDLYRRELWREMKGALKLHQRAGAESFYQAAWAIRERARHHGRRPEQRIISRVLLVKGLEFERAVVLDPHQYDGKSFYVAATRARDALTVVAPKSSLKFAPPTNVLPPL